MSSAAPRIGLLVTCPVDLFRPAVGWATVDLLEAAGCHVEVPAQSCCGQVAYNTGDRAAARSLAWQVVTAFEHFDYTVLPSGSCAGMIVHHYPRLFDDDERGARVRRFCERVHELTRFLVEVMDFRPDPSPAGSGDVTVTYHDSCAGLRELGIRQQPRQLLSSCAGVTVTEMQDTEVCCGFGGTFCVKYPEISHRMARDKLANARATGAQLLLGGDLSCLMHLAGTATRQADSAAAPAVQVRHVAEVLAGRLDEPPIGQGPSGPKPPTDD